MNNLNRDIERAANSYKKSDDGRWAAAYFAARVVGKYEYGATIRLSQRMGCSTDTVENLAHAYMLYYDLRSIPKYRQMVRAIRRMPYIFYSYFRALYKAREDYGLSNDKIISLLIDMVQAEGSMSQRDLDAHIQSRYGDTRNWTFYGQKAHKQLHILLQQPDLPKKIKRRMIAAYEILGKTS
jgi:hypothetical protein